VRLQPDGRPQRGLSGIKNNDDRAAMRGAGDALATLRGRLGSANLLGETGAQDLTLE
jgi:hypothetical protein